MKRALDTVNEKILAAVKRRAPSIVAPKREPRLVAVSKVKPIQSLIEAYECGQRFFGENYIKELESKSNCLQLLEKCPEIKFHFIGHLQSNKVGHLLKVKNLHMIETIDSIKLADLIERAIEKRQQQQQQDHEQSAAHQPPILFSNGNPAEPSNSAQLKVLIQVNTSGEEAKSGVEPENVLALARHIVGQCRWLRLAGFMTIGRLGGWPDHAGPNKDFERLYALRQLISRELAIEASELELSMGMSADFEEAVELGSTNVRVGTMIFGERAARQRTPSPP